MGQTMGKPPQSAAERAISEGTPGGHMSRQGLYWPVSCAWTCGHKSGHTQKSQPNSHSRSLASQPGFGGSGAL